MARTSPDAYTLVDPSSFLPFTAIVEGGGGAKDAIEALATNSNHIHRQAQKTYLLQDCQESAETEYITRATSAASGSPDLIHVWYVDHLLSDADIKVTIHYKTTDGGGGGRVAVKCWLIEPDAGTYTVFDTTLDNAAWTTYNATLTNVWSSVDDPTDNHILVLGVYEVDVGASIELKHVTAESVADATTTVAIGIRSSGFIPCDDAAYDANSPLDIAHAQQLLDNIDALQTDKTSTFLQWSEYLVEPLGDFLKSSALSAEWVRIVGPIPVSVLPGRTLKYAILGYGEHAACKYRVFTGYTANDKGDGTAFLQTSGSIVPTTFSHWATGTLTPKPADVGEMLEDKVYVEWVTPDDGGGGGRDTGILGIAIWEE